MSIFANFLRSLVLTTLFSFIAPIFFVGGTLVFLCLSGYIPGLQAITENIPTQILHFLATFGTGSPLNGLFVISLTCGFVGGLFDIYAYYRCQILRIDS
ncbi:hypothetical protein H6G54_08175 [Anabaena cylindrica FACHB-243]|uniref:Uncharacterized protein n=1 Tax=Anabaena cylindrica (strain ATCC 27899 / PCC 7122) TaxID=272123 RepID=K9ZPL0_ANACC|nr:MULTISPECIES: hypothetical protein [Anabaena]AFZ60265.1 hypothetical protein Anacy_4925 [Anabaena cylindrica PCC 7122]MBD2417682.1 hypothetical protein [Anabaena cylindrica FACHB-243]MBY5281259.1 hypothetical protein [Anabaena sp. CCAP 1446/1C]MBY5306657.1 hypothetical protein [Anabaena sp. CCAP 1446/1C]MCM2404597.1 hypothetical protein [Anabaena sp. CCAP 1446/1C]